MKKILLSIGFAALLAAKGQTQNVAINNDGSQPAASAMLDIKSNSKGLLIPRMTAAEKAAIASPANGLLLYQTDGAQGFYYYNGAAWVPLANASSSPLAAWGLAGNAGTDSTVHFIGTTDNRPLIAKVAGAQAFRLSALTQNSFFGYGAGKNNTALENTFFGYGAGTANTASDNNTFIGAYAGTANTTGTSNHFVGDRAGQANTTGTENYFSGFLSGRFNSTGSYNHFSGAYSGSANTVGSNNYFSGYKAGAANTQGTFNTFIGNNSGAANATGVNNFFAGWQAGAKNSAGSYNLMVGADAGYNNTASDNHFVGAGAGYKNTTGNYNLFIGEDAGHENATGVGNVFIGMSAGYDNTASNNFFVGYAAGNSNTSGTDNTFIGNVAGNQNATGAQNLFVGRSAGKLNTTGSFNQFAGYEAGYANNGSSYNYFSGYQSGRNHTAGNYNTFVGYKSGYLNAGGAGNVFLGYQAGYNEQGNNKLYIDNSATGTPLVYGDFSARLFRTYGNAEHTRAAFSSTIPLLFLNESGNNPVRVKLGNDANTHYWDASALPGDAGNANARFDFNYTNSVNTSLVFRLFGDKDAWLGGTLYQASDRRLKKDVQPLNDALAKLLRLGGYTYRWIDAAESSAQQIGLLAQEVEKEFPQAVKTNEKGEKSVAYAAMVPVLLEAVREQQKQIDELKALIQQKK